MAAEDAVGRLLAALRPQSKSLLMTMFGDTIAARGGCVSIASLIITASVFGISARNVRTAVLRLANEGWLQARRRGRYSDYLLPDSSQARFAEAHERVYRAPAASGGGGDDDNDGRWLLLLPGRLDGAAFRRLRQQLRWSGFAAAGSGVLIHPGDGVSPALLDELGVADKVVLFSGACTASPAMRAVVANSWDLAAINARYARFGGHVDAMRRAAGRRLDAAAAFVLRTLLIHEYRRVLLHDPLLPPALLPARWGGARARAACATLYKKLTPAADAYVNLQLDAGGCALPPPADFYYQRFGGLPRGVNHATDT